MQRDLTQGKITGNILLFALPLMAGNLLQQMYNIADTWVVGHFLGTDALGAVGSAYTLMTFLTSILLGLCMGSGAAVSMQYGKGDMPKMRRSIFMSFALIAVISLVLNGIVYLANAPILTFLRVPGELKPMMQEYLLVIYAGIFATFLYNYYASLLRAIGNSVTPLIFLAVSAVLNVGLDLFFVAGVHWGIKGAAIATVFSQYVSGIGIWLYAMRHFPELLPHREDRKWEKKELGVVLNLSVMTCIQQSIMNFGILRVQDFGNAFSTFVAQNYGSGNRERIRKEVKSAAVTSGIFCVVLSAVVCGLAKQLMGFFVDAGETQVIAVGVNYLRIEGACYIGIGILFLLYGYFRAVNRPFISVVLTVLSLGTRVVLAYTLSAVPAIGVTGIWWSVPIGWALADVVGIIIVFKTFRV